MKCIGCGLLIPDDSKYCQYCGHIISEQSGQQDRPAFSHMYKGRMRYTVMMVVAVVSLLLAVGAVGILLFDYVNIAPRLRGELDFGYYIADSEEAAATYHEMVTVQGFVCNDGRMGCNASLHVEFSDSRGWRIEPVIDLEWVEPDGGRVYVEEYYDWPDYFDGQYLDAESLSIHYHLETRT